MVEPIVRVHSHRPCVNTFMRASTYELTNSPATNATSDAAAMRQVEPNAVSYAAWFFQKGAGGNCTTTHAIKDAKASAPKPAQITRRDRAYPYTSVRMSPNTYEIGKNRTPAPKTNAPRIGRSIWAIFAGPTRFEHTSTVTKPTMTRS